MVILGGSNFLKADNVKEGDKITFTDEGAWVENTKYTYPDGKPKQDFIIGIKVNKEESPYSFRLNKGNRTNISKNWGNDTAKWIGKEVPLKIVDVMVSGKMMKSIIVMAEEVGWDD